MTEDFQRESPAQDDSAMVYRLCRHKYAGTLHLTNLWWSDSDDQVLGTDALSERAWLDHLGRARLHVNPGTHPLRLQVLSADARECLVPLTTYLATERDGHAWFVRQIGEELAQENAAMTSAMRGMAFTDGWLSVLEHADLRQAWHAEMIRRGFSGDPALETPVQSAMPTRLLQQARRTWSTSYEGARARHASLIAEWDALREDEARASGPLA